MKGTTDGPDTRTQPALPGMTAEAIDGVLAEAHRVTGGRPAYLTFDIDSIDPAFAPGISHREPGGMSTREAIAHLHAIEGNIVGADLVEYNPVQDVAGVTATAAAKILKEILGKMIAA